MILLFIMIRRNLNLTCSLLFYFGLTFYAKGQVSAGQTFISRSFEMRYFSKDTSANGETDFKGETEWMSTEQRVQALQEYTRFGSRFFDDPALDKRLIAEKEIDSLLGSLKPQPSPAIRQELRLTNWKKYGYRTGQEKEKAARLTRWKGFPGTSIENGSLRLKDAAVEEKTNPLNWRSKLETLVKVDKGASFSLRLSSGKKDAVRLRISDNRVITFSPDGQYAQDIRHEDWVRLLIEMDFIEKRFNLYVNEILVNDFSLFADPDILSADLLSLENDGIVEIKKLFILNHQPQDIPTQPYRSEVIIDEDFLEKKSIAGWQQRNFDDSFWPGTDLPAVHGGLREAGESLYLRTWVRVEKFSRATLELETIDPGGEVWVNGQVVAVFSSRHPRKLDLTEYLLPEEKNLIAVRVKPYYSRIPMLHAPDDRHIGWFLGRAKLILSNECMIRGAQVVTGEIEPKNVQEHLISIHHNRAESLKGELEVRYYPWFPGEGPVVASEKQTVHIRPGIENQIRLNMNIPDPVFWTIHRPHLYKVEVLLCDTEGNILDDFVTTTGIRKIGQGEGNLYINGQVEMLNGAQIMGFRPPLEDMAKYNRSTSWENIARDLLSLKKMNANMLRLHVHAEKDTTDGINDPRYAEIADQVGLYLIWSTAGFIREGEAWNVDFEGYPLYMEQVYNHPSIVLWEASNHPNRFKQHDISDTHDYVARIYQTIYSKDRSRLISPTSFWGHTHYANHLGTLDYKGNPIRAVPEFFAHQMTRGSQDGYSGYGAEWSQIRKMPSGWANWAASVLKSNDMAYFNFEHEESAAQPNWELSKGKPWYKVPSYEWSYEEGSIGRKLQTEEWRASQGWQAFSAWESMKKQILIGYDGFSWCTLESGANMGTYQKPLIDNLGHPKLAFYINRMVFQKTWAGSDNVDTVYGPNDVITPVIHHLGEEKEVNLTIRLANKDGKILDSTFISKIVLKGGRSTTRLSSFQFKKKINDDIYFIEYEIIPSATRN